MIKYSSIYVVGWVLIVSLLSIPHIILGQVSYHIQVDFAFDVGAVQGKTVTGYRLYKDGSPVCDAPVQEAQSFECVFVSQHGGYAFSLSALYDDETESPQSAPYQLNLPSEVGIPESVGGFTVERLP